MIFFTADTHFGCPRLVKNIRPEFASIEEHDTHLIEQINKIVGRSDRLIILGDFCLEKPGRYRPQIKCKHVEFILGNHDQPSKIERVFGQYWEYKFVRLTTGERVWCCHYPMAFWNGCHNGTFHAYGHTHNCSMREEMLDRGCPGRRSKDVGVDSAKRLLDDYRPFTEVEFLYSLQVRSGHDPIKR